jgi:signal transduction histidine kinase
MIAAFMLQRAEDRRLQEAALVLADEISEAPSSPNNVEEIVHEEREETNHTGILFAVFDKNGRLVAGEKRIPMPGSTSCETSGRETLRVCRAKTSHGLVAVAASAHAMPSSLFVLSACIATLLAGVVAWFASRPVSRMAIAPLSRLRANLALLNVDGGEAPDFGPFENVLEVDQLRSTIEQLLRRVNRAIELAQRFAANAAHELRTPLTSVRAELELLSEDLTLPPETMANIARVQNKIIEMGVLVERLLVLATPKSMPSEPMEMVSLRDLIEDVVATFTSSEGKQIQTVETDALVRGDAVLLGTMLGNAIANALKIGHEVRVNVLSSDESATIQIDDDGPGVENADRERVFEPFFRTSEALHRRIPGHGLGLALIRHIAESHGGRASFADKPGRGARLEIQLPTAGHSSSKRV